MKHGLFLLTLLLLAGCYSTPTPTPYPLQQYPATWTPAPTPTNTPPGPTATLVIQHTRGPLPTRDPNARLLPSVPRGAVGLWATVRDQNAYAADAAAQQAHILVTPAAELNPGKNNPFVFQIVAAEQTDPLPDFFAGVVVTRTAQANPVALQSWRAAVKPRLVLASVFITDTVQIETLRAHADGLVLENFLHAADSAAGQFPDEAAWKRDTDTLATLSANPTWVVMTAIRFPDNTQLDVPLREQWRNYALASFLLGVNNTHSFFGAPDSAAHGLIVQPTTVNALGTPQSAFAKLNGVYQRRFTRGLVLVNPTADKHAFFLPHKYRDRTGAVISQIEMPPHTGEILVAADQ